MPLSQVEQMTVDELLLHLEYLALEAEEQRKAMQRAKTGGPSGSAPVVQFSRPAKR